MVAMTLHINKVMCYLSDFSRASFIQQNEYCDSPQILSGTEMLLIDRNINSFQWFVHKHMFGKVGCAGWLVCQLSRSSCTVIGWLC